MTSEEPRSDELFVTPEVFVNPDIGTGAQGEYSEDSLDSDPPFYPPQTYSEDGVYKPPVAIAIDGHVPTKRDDPDSPLIQRYKDESRDGTQPFVAGPPGDGMNWRDRYWAYLWYFTVALFFVIAISSAHITESKHSIKGDSRNFNIAPMLAAIGVSVTFTGFWLYFMKICAANLIRIMLIAAPCLLIINGIILASVGAVVFSVFFFIGGLIAMFYAYRVWKRIPFSETCLNIAIQAFRKYKAPILVNLFMTASSMFIAAMDIYVMIVIHFTLRNKSGNVNFGEVCVLILWFFVFVWHMITTMNVSYVTSCGVMATWFFGGNSDGVTWHSFKRAMSTSFGSVCLGSLIETFVRVLTTIAKYVKNKARNNNNRVLMIIACCFQCLLQTLGDIVRYLNSYAFVQVATYGKSYCTAARDTYDLFQNRGMDALINDDLTGIPFAVGGILCLMVVQCVMLIMSRGELLATSVIGIAIGFCIYYGVITVLISYIKTLFVCWAEDASVFAENHPEAYTKLVECAVSLDYDTSWCT